MRKLLALSALLIGVATRLSSAQSCTGLCLQQVACSPGQTTSISGVVYAPNGQDPLPNVQVYIPNAAVDAFTKGVNCPVQGAPPSGSPLVGTNTGVDGSFTLTDVPVGTDIPLVIVTGRWRRQVLVPTTSACVDTAFSTRMPRNQTEGDIPKIAVVTGSADSVECVLRKVGIDDSEFTDPGGGGRINFFAGSGSAGSKTSASTPSENTLMGDSTLLNQYDVLMLPCQGGAYGKASTPLANLIGFANAGGRVYSSHFSYTWMYNNPPFNNVVNWLGSSGTYLDGTATVDQSFGQGQTLAQWLQLVGATTTVGQMPLSTIKHDFNGVNPPTRSWLTLNGNNAVMQFVFDAPVGATANQCGRVLFNEYHVENPVIPSANKIFPAECPATAMTPQEKLLEFSLFELTSDGGEPTLTPIAQDFGSAPVGFKGASYTFTWTNNSSFNAAALPTVTGDFSGTYTKCNSVPAGTSCNIEVTFTPTNTGPATGSLIVMSSGKSITAALTGLGTPSLVLSGGKLEKLDFGSLDVGATATKSLILTNTASGPVATPAFVTTGDYSATSDCPLKIAAGTSCNVAITFKPTSSGTRAGGMTTSPANNSVAATMTGNGIDFALALTSPSGTTVNGYVITTKTTLTPLAGFASPVKLSCSTTAPGASCSVSAGSMVPSDLAIATVTLNTTAKYVILGYGGLGGGGLLTLLAAGSGLLLWTRRSNTRSLLRSGALAVLLAAASLFASGCSGKAPAENSSYTPPGTYTFTVSATDGFLTHSAVYTLKVTAP